MLAAARSFTDTAARGISMPLSRQRVFAFALAVLLASQGAAIAADQASDAAGAKTSQKTPTVEVDVGPVGPQSGEDAQGEKNEQGEKPEQPPQSVRSIDLHTQTDRMHGLNGYHVDIPKVRTKITIAGFIKADLVHDFREMDSLAKFIPATITVPSVEKGQTTMSVNPSRLIVGSASETRLGRLTTMFSMDMFANANSRSPSPRLRQAFAELDGLLFGGGIRIGQSWSTWDDVTTLPDTLDFEGPNGSDQTRQPLLRWIRPVRDDWLIWLAIENPDTEISGPGDPDSETRSPDGVATLQYKRGFGHVKLALLLRDIGASDGGESVYDFGWGIQSTGRISLPGRFSKDDFRYQIQYGHGIGRYINAGLEDAVIQGTDLELIPYFSGYVAFRHYWAEKWRSTASFGWVQADNQPLQTGTALNRTFYASANVIYSLREQIDMGAEVLWGDRRNQNGQTADNWRIQFSTKVGF